MFVLYASTLPTTYVITGEQQSFTRARLTYCANMEEAIHRRAIVIQVKVGDRSKVGLVANTSNRHLCKKPVPLPNTSGVRLYTGWDPTNVENTFDSQVTRVDSSILCCILLIYNTVAEQFDKIGHPA